MWSEPLYKDLIQWGIVVLFMLVGLIILMKILKSAVGSKVRNFESFDSIRFDDLGQMKEKGLLTEEEFARVKKRMAQRALEQSQQSPSKILAGEAALRSALIEAEHRRLAREIAKEGKPDTTEDNPPSAIAQTEATEEIAPAVEPAPAVDPPKPELQLSIQKKSSNTQSEKLFDLEKLLASGAIDAAEYKRLREYFLKKSDG